MQEKSDNNLEIQHSKFDCGSKLRILHISDIQEGIHGIKPNLGMENEDQKYIEILNDIKNQLEQIHRNDPIDIIVISGDLVSTGNYKEYQNLTRQFMSILDSIFLKNEHQIPKNRWIVVPGNHDVEWNKKEGRFNSFIHFCNDNKIVNKYILDDPESIFSSLVIKSKKGQEIAIIGINSCLGIFEESTRKVATIQKSYFNRISRKWNYKFRMIPKIMICHHRLHEISYNYDNALKQLRENNVLLAMVGDHHTSNEFVDIIEDMGCIVNGSLLSLNKYRTIGVDIISRQFVILNIDFESGDITRNVYLKENEWIFLKSTPFQIIQYNSSPNLSKLKLGTLNLRLEAEEKSSLILVIYSKLPLPENKIANFKLDFSKYFNDREAQPKDWNKILQKTDKLKYKFTKIKTRLIYLYIKAHISIGITVGFKFRKQSGFLFRIFYENQYVEYNEKLPGENSDLIASDLSTQEAGNDDLVLMISIARDINANTQNFLKSNNLTPKYSLEFRLKNFTIQLNSDNLSAIVNRIIYRIREIKDKYHIRIIHIFAAVPIPLAVFLGYNLNAMGIIQLYEFDAKKNTYHKSIKLE